MSEKKRRRAAHKQTGETAVRKRSTREFIFLCGVARSGTTAATRLLNMHPKVAMGMERYKFLYGNQEFEITPELFTTDRFFDYRATDTNIRLARGGFAQMYHEMKPKYARARLVGDKLPRFYQLFDRVLAAFPTARFIYMLRDPLRTASSWQARADNARDSWSPENNAGKAISEWNSANSLTLAFANANPSRLRVVPYDALFGGDDATLKSLLDWLDLRHAPEILDHYRAQVAPEAQSIAQKLSLLPQEQQDELARAADWQTYRQLIALAPQPTAPSAAVRAKKKERRRAKRRETTDGRTEDAVS